MYVYLQLNLNYHGLDSSYGQPRACGSDTNQQAMAIPRLLIYFLIEGDETHTGSVTTYGSH